MNRKNAIIGLYTETPLHTGTGQIIGVIDLPVQRETHTGHPYIPSSSIKGSMRNSGYFEKDMASILFGSEIGSDGHAGSLALSDARILAFPIRTLQNLFVWVTSDIVLDRLRRDLQMIGVQDSFPIPKISDSSKALVTLGIPSNDSIVLEDLMLTPKEDPNLTETSKIIASLCMSDPIYETMRGKFTKNLVVVSEENFAHLTEFATERIARNVLDEKKKSRNLWYMEQIPRDTLFYFFAMADHSRNGNEMDADSVLNQFVNSCDGKHIQLGGHESLGKGWCMMQIHSKGTLKSGKE